jgi:hypothetical protein
VFHWYHYSSLIVISEINKSHFSAALLGWEISEFWFTFTLNETQTLRVWETLFRTIYSPYTECPRRKGQYSGRS